MKISAENLGGARVHGSISGNSHLCKNDEEALELVRLLLSYLPNNNEEKPPTIKVESDDDYRQTYLKSFRLIR